MIGTGSGVLVGGCRRYQEKKRGNSLTPHSRNPGSWDVLDRSPMTWHSSKSSLEREVECDQGDCDCDPPGNAEAR